MIPRTRGNWRSYRDGKWMVVPRGGGDGGVGCCCVTGTESQFWVWKSPGEGGGAGYVAVCRHVVLLNCTLKILHLKVVSIVYQTETKTDLNQHKVIPEGLNATAALQELGEKW